LRDSLMYCCPQLCVGAGPSMQLISSSPFLATAHLSSVLPEFPQDPPFLCRGRAWFPHASLGRCCRSFGRHSGGPGKAWWRQCPLRRGHEIIQPASFSCTSLGTKRTLRVLFSVTSPNTNVSADWSGSCCHSCSRCVTAAQSWWIHHQLWKWHEIIRPLRQLSVWEEDVVPHNAFLCWWPGRGVDCTMLLFSFSQQGSPVCNTGRPVFPLDLQALFLIRETSWFPYASLGRYLSWKLLFDGAQPWWIHRPL